MEMPGFDASDKRYVVSLQDPTDRQCYKDFLETDKQEEAKQKADEEAEKYQRNALVFDRKMGVIYKKEIVRPEDKKPEKPLPPRRGRRRKEEPVVTEVPVEEKPKKIIRKEAYFE